MSLDNWIRTMELAGQRELKEIRAEVGWTPGDDEPPTDEQVNLYIEKLESRVVGLAGAVQFAKMTQGRS